MADWSERLPFTEEAVLKHVPPNRGGVFRLMCQRGKGCMVFYVGQGANLSGSLMGILREGAPNERVAELLRESPCLLCYTTAASPLERLAIAEAEIAKFKPVGNVQ